MTRAAMLQLNASDDPESNLTVTRGFLREAVQGGAEFVLTPEVTNCLSSNRTRQQEVLQHQDDDLTLQALRSDAREFGIWLLIGSLALKTGDPDGRFANRSFLIDPGGDIAGWYDKIHMFDVQVSETETYCESDGYRPGNRAVCAQTPFGTVGMTVCYDVRFPYLHRALAKAGAMILTVPAAFSQVTGAAHWHALLRARAIETGCYVLAPAQTGSHDTHNGQPRRTYGHSLAVSPWGEVLVDAGTEACVTFVDLDTKAVIEARRKVPSLTHDRKFDGP
ncbi:carbon-nitrogen hydrolase family protein [Thalassovita sp.]|uniref:carbon-nitrogen hydrolase family protein n=1 Tax=Thalassovita sp. TaxID=1979401 RepID=UPI002B26FB93|nr:carbon-nitrogen hydrolase family protein [Thalassovita sp.]